MWAGQALAGVQFRAVVRFLMGKDLLKDGFLVGKRVLYGRDRVILQRQILAAGGKGAVIGACRRAERF